MKVLRNFVFALFLAGCVQNPDVVDPLGGKTFWTYKINLDNPTDPYELVQVSAYLAGVSDHAKIFVEVNRGVTQAQVDQLLLEFEHNIYPNLQQNLAEPLDVNEDNRVTFLLLDIQDSYSQPGDSYLGGYFDPFNMYRETTVLVDAQVRSNEEDMLYLDIYPSVINSQNFLATMAHEYQHLLQFSFRYRSKTAQEYTWLDEGISEVSSDIAGYGPQNSRLRYADNSLANGNSIFVWDSKVQDYSNAYLLLRYLADIYGNQFIYKLFNDPLVGIDSLQNILQQQNDDAFLKGCTNNQYTVEREEVYCALIHMWADILDIDDNDTHYFEKDSQSFNITPGKGFTTDISALTANISSRLNASVYSTSSSFSFLPGGYALVKGIKEFGTNSSNFTLLRSSSFDSGDSEISLIFNHNFASQEADFSSSNATLSSQMNYMARVESFPKPTPLGEQQHIYIQLPTQLESQLQLAGGAAQAKPLQGRP